MQTLKTELLIFFDVDDTLIMWRKTHEKAIKFTDPYSYKKLTVWPNFSNINLLKEKAVRGFTVIVWSAAGYQHAEAVVKALNLDAYVAFIMSKPTAYIDDKDVNRWWPKRVYLEPEMRYKNGK